MLFRSCWCVGLLLLVSALWPPQRANAEELKPIAVLSLSSLEKSLPDARYLLSILGQEQIAGQVRTLGLAFSAGIDRKRPAGALFIPNEEDEGASLLFFLPVSDLKELLAIYKPYLGELADEGDGVLKLAGGDPYYLKQDKGWAYVVSSKSLLARLPDDPLIWLGNLPQRYNVALKVLPQNMPAAMKEQLLVSIEEGRQEQEAIAETEDAEVAAGRRWGFQVGEKALLDVLATEEFTLGLQINSADKKLLLESNYRFAKDSPAARMQPTKREFRTQLAGLRIPDAALHWNYTTRLDQQGVKALQQRMETIGTWLSSYSAEIKDETLKQEFAQRQNAAQALVAATIQSRELDLGATVVFRDKEWGVVLGGRVPDQAQVRKIVAQYLKALEANIKTGALTRSEFSEGNWKFEVYTHAITAAETFNSRMYGPTLQFVYASNGPYALIGYGNKGADLVRSVVSNSKEPPLLPAKEISAVHLEVRASRVFGQVAKDNPLLGYVAAFLGITGTLGRDNDQLIFATLDREQDQVHRLEIGEGVVRLLGPFVLSALEQINTLEPPSAD